MPVSQPSGFVPASRWIIFPLIAALGAGTAGVVSAGDELTAQPGAGDPLDGLLPEELDRFEAGKIQFDTSITIEEGLGPIWNFKSCGLCHNNPLGGPGFVLVERFGRMKGNGDFDPLAEYGGPLRQLQQNDGDCREDVPAEANIVINRVTNGAFGYGLIEAIPDATIAALQQDPPGVSGRVHWVEALEDPGTPRVGRFGWKSQVATLLTFAADASLNEMGLTNRLLPDDLDPNGIRPPALADCDDVPDPEDGPDAEGYDRIDRVADFQRFLAAPPQTPRSGMQGESIFFAIGCVQCHHGSFQTADDPVLEDALRDKTIRPYSDFLLHDMGAASDGFPQGDAEAHEMRTPPLWGLRRRNPLWHDGRHSADSFSQRVQAAISSHGSPGSEAGAVFGAWNFLPPASRDAVVRFLDSLGRREFDMDGDDNVDLDDFFPFADCFGSGPYLPDDPCAVSDVDQDADVDLDDWSVFLQVYSGPDEDCNDNGILDLTDIIMGTSLDEDGDGRPDECPAVIGPCAGDVNGTGRVDTVDLALMIAAWGPCASCPEDVDSDGTVGLFDLVALLATWGICE